MIIPLTDRQFWLLIRRALLMICRAIEDKYLCDDKDD